MVSVLRELNKFYGNRRLIFDVFLAVAITLTSFLIVKRLRLTTLFTDDFFFSLIEFLGVLAGFLLTAFSLLYLYNPTESKQLSEFRKHPLFLMMLKTFLSTIIFAVLSVVIVYLHVSLQRYASVYFAYVIFFLLTLTLLRIMKCVYYLFIIVDIGKTSSNPPS